MYLKIIMLMTLSLVLSCESELKKIEIEGIDDKELSKVLGRNITYLQFNGAVKDEACLCIKQVTPSNSSEWLQINCMENCDNKILLSCPFFNIGLSYKDHEPNPYIKKINDYFYQQEGERSKHPLIADRNLEYYEKIKRACFIQKRVSGIFEVKIVEKGMQRRKYKNSY